MKKNKGPSFLHSLKVAAIIIGLTVLYAIGFTVTKVNLEETKSEIRQKQLVRIIRALVHPDLFTYDTVDTIIQAKVLVPCSDNAYKGTEIDPESSDPYLVLSSACVNPGDPITVEGFNFLSSTGLFIQFIPPNGVKLNLGEATTDNSGHFSLTTKIPKNRESEEPQTIQVKTSIYAGNLKISGTLKDTWNKIVETLFLALLSTTVGFIFALPLSFFAAKNLMERFKTQFISISFILILIPVGFYLGKKAADIILSKILNLSLSPLLNFLGVIFLAVAILLLFRLLFAEQPSVKKSKSDKIKSFLLKLITGFITTGFACFLASFLLFTGEILANSLGAFSFLGVFIRNMGEILEMVTPACLGLIVAFVFGSFGSKLGKRIIKKTSVTISRFISVMLSMIAYMVICLLIMGSLNWLYEFRNPGIYYLFTALFGGVIGLIFGVIFRPDSQIKIGNVVYLITRTIFNVLRSIESLVMVIVFVVWVGIGPFAGALALALHTIASLGKMYSEQVENILEGPLEAVQATGANLLQQVVYAVIPQIIPPYIAFTLYRWDQNVRMSTIIGFAGGGGIGFLLQQNINLLNYRAASVQMIAIAVVVSLMDYLSGYVRNKIV
ncbi:MAG: ABC transporter permease subunit [Flexilinea sp.]